MDNELESPLSTNENNDILFSYREKFEELFPYYLSIGMTEEQYWDRDCQLVVAYRKADELKMDRTNLTMWLQGAYVYEAIARISPILHAFAKKGTKPIPYPEKPFAISEKQNEYQKVAQEKKTYDKGKMFMETFMVNHNKKYERK